MKAKWLGLPKLQHWDRNAPLPDDDDRTIGWDDARERVLTAYGEFSPDLAEVGRRFFDRPWIDATLKPGKAGGAFAHPTVPSAHPYLLLNYHGRTRDVMTLAHELGHGVHQVLAAEQGYLMAGTPLTLAETASVFGEMLTFRALLDAADPKRRRIMLAAKVEDMLNTVVRQIAFYHFESLLHDERRSGELVPDRIGELWLQVQKESLGPAFEFTPEYTVFWAYVPHFIHSPFYVYAYAFGDCLVNALYSVFQSGHPGFQAKYLNMLRAGGTKRHKELLAPFGLDASDPAFWKRGPGCDRRLHRRAGAGGVKEAVKGREGTHHRFSPSPCGRGLGEGAGGASLLAARLARCAERQRQPNESSGRRTTQASACRLKFRRQVPLGPYIADFYCPSARLVVEVDGVSHIDAPGVAVRDTWMGERRISSWFDFQQRSTANLEGVLVAIGMLARAPPPPAPSRKGRGSRYHRRPSSRPPHV